MVAAFGGGTRTSVPVIYFIPLSVIMHYSEAVIMGAVYVPNATTTTDKPLFPCRFMGHNDLGLNLLAISKFGRLIFRKDLRSMFKSCPFREDVVVSPVSSQIQESRIQRR